MVETADIVVIGGGCIGASIALHLAQKKAGKIILLEKKELANGASGKGIGIIRTHYTHPVLAKLANRSLQQFHQFRDLYGGYESGFNSCGYYVLVGEEDIDTLKQLIETHQSFGIEVSLVDPQQVQTELPHLNLNDVAAIAYEPLSGYGSPPQTTQAFARRAADLGVEVRTHTPVKEIQLNSQGQIEAVITSAGAIATNIVIDCVGPWARKFAEHLGLEFPVVPVVEHVVVIERPSQYSQSHPVISDLVNLCYSRSDCDRPYTRIGNSDPKYHSQFKLEDADDFDGQLFPHISEDLYQKLIYRYPSFETGKVVDKYSGIWGVTPDYQPIIDRLSIEGFYCAVGFSGHGYKLSPVIGELMSQFILGESNAEIESLKLFRFSRFQENDLIKPPISYNQARGLR